MTVLITGARGQLARAIATRMEPAHDVVALPRDDLDITDVAAVADAFRRVRPRVVINGAAYNDVDGAESDPVQAFAVNAYGVRALARATIDHGATLVHFSTDFVFDGTAVEPYPESAPPSPQSVYATSKLLGEWFAGEARSYVLRVESLFGGVPEDDGGAVVRGSSVDRMADAILAGRTVRAFADRTVTPSYVVDVADVVNAMLARSAPPGLYHCVGSGVGTWVDVARALVECLGCAAAIVPTRMAEQAAAWPAQRPQYCALASEKLGAIGIVMPPWRDALARYAAVRREGDAGRGRGGASG